MNIVIIGLGGVGTIVADVFSRYLNYSQDFTSNRITLIDGDSFEPKNATRQVFQNYGNKAESKKKELASKFKEIEFNAFPSYVNDSNSSRFINENDIVFMAVDNHKSRKIVSDRCKQLNNILLISGGNELEDGNIQVYVKKDGKEITPPIDKYHPEIAFPENNSPEELSCEERQISHPQLFFMNMMIACYMCSAFYAVFVKGALHADVYIDIVKLNSDSKIRLV